MFRKIIQYLDEKTLKQIEKEVDLDIKKQMGSRPISSPIEVILLDEQKPIPQQTFTKTFGKTGYLNISKDCPAIFVKELAGKKVSLLLDRAQNQKILLFISYKNEKTGEKILHSVFKWKTYKEIKFLRYKSADDKFMLVGEFNKLAEPVSETKKGFLFNPFIPIPQDRIVEVPEYGRITPFPRCMELDLSHFRGEKVLLSFKRNNNGKVFLYVYQFNAETKKKEIKASYKFIKFREHQFSDDRKKYYVGRFNRIKGAFLLDSMYPVPKVKLIDVLPQGQNLSIKYCLRVSLNRFAGETAVIEFKRKHDGLYLYLSKVNKQTGKQENKISYKFNKFEKNHHIGQRLYFGKFEEVREGFLIDDYLPLPKSKIINLQDNKQIYPHPKCLPLKSLNYRTKNIELVFRRNKQGKVRLYLYELDDKTQQRSTKMIYKFVKFDEPRGRGNRYVGKFEEISFLYNSLVPLPEEEIIQLSKWSHYTFAPYCLTTSLRKFKGQQIIRKFERNSRRELFLHILQINKETKKKELKSIYKFIRFKRPEKRGRKTYIGRFDEVKGAFLSINTLPLPDEEIIKVTSSGQYKAVECCESIWLRNNKNKELISVFERNGKQILLKLYTINEKKQKGELIKKYRFYKYKEPIKKGANIFIGKFIVPDFLTDRTAELPEEKIIKISKHGYIFPASSCLGISLQTYKDQEVILSYKRRKEEVFLNIYILNEQREKGKLLASYKFIQFEKPIKRGRNMFRGKFVKVLQ